MELCDKESCTGCGMCADICANKAIIMKPDKYGFLYPEIDKTKCTDCNLCQEKCPMNCQASEGNTVYKVYAAWNKDRLTRKNSSSGGVFSLLAKKVLSDGGIVAGVKWDEQFHTCHCCIEKEADLHLLNGSKYVQSVTGNIYSIVKANLHKGKKVLFSGTPCQVHALLQYLGKSYEKLFTVDLVCHGVPSSDLFDRHLNEIMNGQKQDIKSVSLRYKKPCWSYGSVRVEAVDKPLYMKLTIEDAYFNLFNFNYSLRPSCHICRYTNMHRNGDVTLADFWGYSPKSIKMRDYDRGVSCILINTGKGDRMFNKIKKELVYEESTINAAKQANQSLTMPFAEPTDCKEFWKDYEDGMLVSNLNKKYISKPYTMPNAYGLRRLKRQYSWLYRKLFGKRP